MSLLTKWRQRKHFKQQILFTYKKLWDVEFLRKRFKNEREQFRKQYDKLKEHQVQGETRLGEEKSKKEPDKGIIKTLEDTLARIAPDIEQLQNKMHEIDKQIEGPGGCNESIDGYRALIDMLQEHKKKL